MSKKIVYHGCTHAHNNIKLNVCHFGFHCGTLCQAIDIANPERLEDKYDWENRYIYVCKIYPTKNNCIEIKDLFTYDCMLLPNMKKIIKASILKNKKYKNILYHIDECDTLEELRQLLLNNNIKYIKYFNSYETNGYSYCIIDDEFEYTLYTMYDYLTNLQTLYKQ